MKNVPLGTTGRAEVEVTRDTLASTCKSGAVPVFATPNLVLLMEMAAVNALEPYMEPGEVTVGTLVDVRHLAATPPGLTVTATARLTEIDGRRLVFHVEAHDGVELIGTGTHERFLVNYDRFVSRANEKSAKT
ncbi:MAG TPA: thioesterase family protein [Firmicutes bacterium]|nr:thioesterase family protein [Candidatus Fermentithermobacillaceae bacterium]